VAEKAVEVQQIAIRLKAITSPRMISDLTTAIALAKAALEGAMANVEINIESIAQDTSKGAAFVTEVRKRMVELKTQA
jgi:glutamate formiminotransferase / formiminotetrahydrofolate cyclodeaminase